MSALDQAFIKAYAKDGPPLGDAAFAREAAPATRTGGAITAPTVARIVRTAPAVQVESIERMYHEGSLYRVDGPRTAAPRRAAVPAPHIQLPPPTSPKRNVRRSMLQLLGQASELATPMTVEPPPRAESVIRQLHDAQRPKRSARTLAEIADELAPQPVPTPPPVRRPSDPPVRRATRVELAPEIVIDTPPAEEPFPIKSAPEPKLPAQPLVAPAVIPVPNVAPLNLARAFEPQFEVHGHWDNGLPTLPGSLVVTPEPADLHLIEPAQQVELKLEALPEPGPLVAPAAATPAVPAFRVDPPHATVAAKPHAKFAPANDEPPVVPEPASEASPDYFGDATEEPAEPEPISTPPQPRFAEELSFAEQEASVEPGTNAQAAVFGPVLNTDCVPQWEVDRFQWPVTVERLVSDKDGYFAQASGRLLAAVRDGLRTLAISGSRRGEGRTTLALALARAAAKADIQVAVIDADFARPQLAARIGLEIHHGWQDAATGLVPLSETAIRSLADNITMLPLEASAARTGLSLADSRVTATLRAAAATFELVIVDLGPLAASDEPLFPADEACPIDAAIVVRDLRYASAAESEDIGQRLMAAGIEAVGIAENFVVEDEVPATSV